MLTLTSADIYHWSCFDVLVDFDNASEQAHFQGSLKLLTMQRVTLWGKACIAHQLLGSHITTPVMTT